MLSKLLRCPYREAAMLLSLRQGRSAQRVVVRRVMGLIPPNQYDVPLPKRLNLGYVLRVYWETIPLVFVTGFALSLMCSYILWCTGNKVDVVFSSHNRRNLSRTMDLRYPTSHKVIIINQRYEPWPELADLIDKMTAAEKRNLTRLESCAFP